MLRWLLLVAVLLPFTAKADPHSGWAYLALETKNFDTDKAYDLLASSPCPAFSFVYRAFGSHTENALLLRDRLASDSHAPHCHVRVTVYADCGPCRYPRRAKGAFPRIVFPTKSISQINGAIESRNGVILSGYYRLYSSLSGVLTETPGVEYLVYPALEDNYSPKAARALQALLRKAFRGRRDVLFGRNPMRVQGHEAHLELHQPTLAGLTRGQSLSLDGFPQGVRQARRLVRGARRQKIDLYLWLPQLQGLTKDPKSTQLPQAKRTPTFNKTESYLTIFN